MRSASGMMIFCGPIRSVSKGNLGSSRMWLSTGAHNSSVTSAAANIDSTEGNPNLTPKPKRKYERKSKYHAGPAKTVVREWKSAEDDNHTAAAEEGITADLKRLQNIRVDLDGSIKKSEMDQSIAVMDTEQLLYTMMLNICQRNLSVIRSMKRQHNNRHNYRNKRIERYPYSNINEEMFRITEPSNYTKGKKSVYAYNIAYERLKISRYMSATKAEHWTTYKDSNGARPDYMNRTGYQLDSDGEAETELNMNKDPTQLPSEPPLPGSVEHYIALVNYVRENKDRWKRESEEYNSKRPLQNAQGKKARAKTPRGNEDGLSVESPLPPEPEVVKISRVGEQNKSQASFRKV
jgi:hypothetical protein